jgi:hypothetical protein
VLKGELAERVGDELKELLADQLKKHEKDVRDYLNQALAQALKDKKAAELFKGPGKKE